MTTLVGLRSRTATKTVKDLSQREYEECRELTFCGQAHLNIPGEVDYGSMQGKLDGLRGSTKPDYVGWATMLRNTDGEMVGWALTFRIASTLHTYYFVPAALRRQGIGTRLFRAVRRRFGPTKTHPWDRRSAAFFRTVEGG